MLESGKDDTMNIRWLGAILVVCSCGCTGFRMAALHRWETSLLRQLITVMDYLECELQLRHTPLPELCRAASDKTTGILRSVFSQLAEGLEKGSAPNADACMRAVTDNLDRLPESVKALLKQFGSNLGIFDLEGQLTGIRSFKQECHIQLDSQRQNQEERLRGYQTLGLCAGAGIAILLI